MKHFLIITNTYKDTGLARTRQLSDYIRKKGGSCHCFYSTGETLAAAAPRPGEIPKETDGILVLGGDGTLIRAASRLVGTRLPLIGVNLGTLGYLCELEEQNLCAAIDRLMAEDYIVEQRMMLEGYALTERAPADLAQESAACGSRADAGREEPGCAGEVASHHAGFADTAGREEPGCAGEAASHHAGSADTAVRGEPGCAGEAASQRAGSADTAGRGEPGNGGDILSEKQKNPLSGIALNDVVIHRTGALSVVSLIVYVNGEYLSTFRADGMIIATPTGSTGYNMSAGGPIVDPKAGMILITPINAHNMNSRSIVVGAEDEIVVELAKRRAQKDERVEVSYDGDGAGVLSVGDRLTVRRAKETVGICKLSRKSFLELLSRKMQSYT